MPIIFTTQNVSAPDFLPSKLGHQQLNHLEAALYGQDLVGFMMEIMEVVQPVSAD